jgi:host factor-I protein
MSSKPLQQVFLDKVAADQMPVTLFLVNGVKLSGFVAGHDPYTLLLEFNGAQQSVLKPAVATIAPATPINLMDEGAEKVGQPINTPPQGA